MFYRTLAEMKTNHPQFFDRGTAASFGDVRYNKRGDCVIITQRDPYEENPSTVYKVFDFASGSAMYVGTFSTFNLAEAMAQQVPGMAHLKAVAFGKLISAAEIFLSRHEYGVSTLVDDLHKWMMNARAGYVWLSRLDALCQDVVDEMPQADDIAYALAHLKESAFR